MNSCSFSKLMLAVSHVTVPEVVPSVVCDVFASAFLLKLSQRFCENFLPGLVFEM